MEKYALKRNILSYPKSEVDPRLPPPECCNVSDQTGVSVQPPEFARTWVSLKGMAPSEAEKFDIFEFKFRNLMHTFWQNK